MQAVLIVAGSAIVVTGAALITWPAGLLALGLLMLAAAVDLGR